MTLTEVDKWYFEKIGLYSCSVVHPGLPQRQFQGRDLREENDEAEVQRRKERERMRVCSFH